MSRWIVGLLVAALALGAAYHVWNVDRIRRERNDAERQLASLRETVRALKTEKQEAQEALAAAREVLRAAEHQEEAPEEGEPVEDDSATATLARARELVADARDAFDGMQAEKFLETCFELIDLGEGAFPALLDLLNELDLERLDEIGRALEGDLKSKAQLLGGLVLRMPALSTAMGYILDREPTIDNASLMALTLITRFQVPVPEPSRRVGEIRALAEAALAAQKGDSPPPGGRNFLYAAVRALEKTGDPSAVTALEELYRADPDTFGWNVPQALMRMQTAESAEAIARLYESSDGDKSRRLLDSLAGIQGEEANGQLWSILENEDDGRRRLQVWESLASRPENVDRMLDAIRAPSTDANIRRAILFRMDTGSRGETTALLWDLYQSPPTPDSRDVALTRLVYTGDARATDIAVDRLVSGESSAYLEGAVRSLDRSVIERRRHDLVAAASDPGRPLDRRLAAARTVARLDRGGAVAALMTGYDGLDETSRLRVVSSLSDYSIRGEAARGALQGIVEADPSRRVRGTARGLLERSR